MRCPCSVERNVSGQLRILASVTVDNLNSPRAARAVGLEHTTEILCCILLLIAREAVLRCWLFG